MMLLLSVGRSTRVPDPLEAETPPGLTSPEVGISVRMLLASGIYIGGGFLALVLLIVIIVLILR